MTTRLKPETIAQRSTQIRDHTAGAVASPIYLSTNFERESDGSYRYGYVYSRSDNPNRKALEETLAALEHGKYGLAFSSGMAATSAVFQSQRPGDHIILPREGYYSTNKLALEVYAKWGLSSTIVDACDPEKIKSAITTKTKLIWLETPSNPQLSISDISTISTLAREKGIITVVDNTWATPVHQNPLLMGADIAMHSNSKYMGGHGDVIGGALVIKDNKELYDRLKEIQELGGAVPSPFDCWLLTRGIRTLHVRVRAQAASAARLAEYLHGHSLIEKVHYPGLIDHPGNHVASRQMKDGFGGMLSVEVKGGQKKALELTGKLKLFTTATSLGGTESLVEHRKTIEGESSPTPENLLRISVGLENTDDLISDWESALSED